MRNKTKDVSFIGFCWFTATAGYMVELNLIYIVDWVNKNQLISRGHHPYSIAGFYALFHLSPCTIQSNHLVHVWIRGPWSVPGAYLLIRIISGCRTAPINHEMILVDDFFQFSPLFGQVSHV